MGSRFESKKLGASISGFLWLLCLICALPTADASAAPPRFDHVVVVIFENHGFSQIYDDLWSANLRKAAGEGVLFTRAKGVTNPSQPNYLALYSGSTQGVTDDGDHDLKAPTLGSQMRRAGKRFIGFVEAGSPRKHNPWESFGETAAFGRRLESFPTDFTELPDVAFVIPNLSNDMHDGTIHRGDVWFGEHLSSYAAWAKTHNSLLIVTFDEAYGNDDRIFTLFLGANLRSGHSMLPIDHYTVLRTIQAIEGLPGLANSAKESPIDGVWAQRTTDRRR